MILDESQRRFILNKALENKDYYREAGAFKNMIDSIFNANQEILSTTKEIKSLLPKKKATHKVVLVEDQEIQQRIFKKVVGDVLEEAGCEVFYFSSSTRALSFLKRADKIDLMVIDFILSETSNGIDVLKKIKAIDKNCPVLMMSASVSPKIIEDSYRYGAEDFFEKGKDLAELYTAIFEILNLKVEITPPPPL